MDYEIWEIIMCVLCIALSFIAGLMIGDRYWFNRLALIRFSSKKSESAPLVPPIPPKVLPSFDEQDNKRTEPVHQGKKENVERFLGV